MEVVSLKERTVYGLRVRMCNADEMNPERAKIGNLWQTFDLQVPVDYKNGERVYGIYSNYESDATGQFDVLASFAPNDPATVSNELESIVIPSGQYLVFTGEGDMPQVVIDTWMQVWDYFSQEKALHQPHQRAFTIDFEFYRSEREVEIHIAIL